MITESVFIGSQTHWQNLPQNISQPTKPEIATKCEVNRSCYSGWSRVMSLIQILAETSNASPPKLGGVSICVLEDSRC